MRVEPFGDGVVDDGGALFLQALDLLLPDRHQAINLRRFAVEEGDDCILNIPRWLHDAQKVQLACFDADRD